MKKYAWIVALLVALSFGFMGCDDKDKDKDKEKEGWVHNLAGQTLDVVDNFEYGKGYQGVGTWPALFAGNRIAAGDEYYIRITFTASRDLTDVLYVGLVDPTAAANYWRPLTWPGDPDKPAPIPGAAEDKIILKDEEVTFEYKFTATSSSTAATAAANAIVFMTDSTDGTPGTAGSGTLGTIKLTFTEFLFGNVDVDSLEPPAPPPPPPPEEVPEITIDATAGTATHDNFKMVVSTANAHGGWDGTDNEDGTFSWKGGAIRYQYPVVAGGFDYKDYDFVEVEYEASGVANSVLKQYATGVDYALLSGSFANGEGTLKFDLRYGGGGFAIQRYGTNATDMTVEIKSITFIKGTRYNITFDTDAEDVTVPADAPTYVVATTKVGPLPSLTREGYIFQGWVKGDPAVAVTATDDVDASFANATLKATWKVGTVQAAQTVTFSYPGNIIPRGATANKPDIELVGGAAAGNGYQITTQGNSYGNSWAYFTYTFTNSANLSDFNKVTFTYQGVSGDINSKPRAYMIVRKVSEIAEGTSNYFGLENAGSSCSSNDAIDGTEPIAITMTIDQGAAAAYDGETIGFIVGLHADDYVIKITNVVFSQD